MKIPKAYLDNLNGMDKPALIAEIVRLHEVIRKHRQPPPGPNKCDICGHPTHAKGQLTATLYFPCCCSVCLDLGLIDPVPLSSLSPEQYRRKEQLWGPPAPASDRNGGTP